MLEQRRQNAMLTLKKKLDEEGGFMAPTERENLKAQYAASLEQQGASPSPTTEGSSGGMSTNKALAAASLLQGVTGFGQGTTSGSEGAASGALSGAAAGSAFGPYGTAIGAGLGAISGIAGASARRKSIKAQAEAQKFQQLQGIEANKQARIQGALQDMRQAFSSALRTPVGIRLGGR